MKQSVMGFLVLLVFLLAMLMALGGLSWSGNGGRTPTPTAWMVTVPSTATPTPTLSGWWQGVTPPPHWVYTPTVTPGPTMTATSANEVAP